MNGKTRKLMDIKPEQLKRIVFAWKNAVAISVSKYDTPETELPIVVSSSSGITIRFIVVSTEPHLILGRKDVGVQYHLGSDEADKLLIKRKYRNNYRKNSNNKLTRLAISKQTDYFS